MVKNAQTNTAIGNEALQEVTEYKIGHTTYNVVTRFNFISENLKDILARLITKEIKKTA